MEQQGVVDTEQKGVQVLSVVGGRMVSQGQASPHYKVTGQQLMMQLDSLTCAMTDMCVQEETMEADDSEEVPEVQESSSPFSQSEKRRDPVYLSSLACHSVGPQVLSPQMPQDHVQPQQHLLQQQLEQQEQQEQLQFQWQLHQLELQHQQQQQQHIQQFGPNTTLTMGSEIYHSGNAARGILKRADLIPMQSCYQ